MKINTVSLQLIDGQLPEDIVREEVKEKNKLLMANDKEVKTKKNTEEIDYEKTSTIYLINIQFSCSCSMDIYAKK